MRSCTAAFAPREVLRSANRAALTDAIWPATIAPVRAASANCGVVGGVSVALLALATLGMASPAAAFCVSTTEQGIAGVCSGGTPTTWHRACVSYSVVRVRHRDLTDQLQTAAEHAFERWLRAECPSGDPPGLQTTATPLLACAEPGFDRATPNANAIMLVSDWSELDAPADSVALTFNWFDTETGEILDTDVALNDSQREFAACPSTGCGDRQRDLETTLTHEVGHFFGLDHSDVDGAMLHVDFERLAHRSVRRDLTSDDLAGICQTYPRAPARCADGDDEPISGLAQGACPARSTGCSVAVPLGCLHGARIPVAWAVAALFAFGRIPRTRRSATRAKSVADHVNNPGRRP